MLWIRRLVKTLAALLLLAYIALIGYGYWPQEPGVPAAQLAGPDDRFISVEGMQIRYQSWGTPTENQPAIVLIHGFGNSAQTFRALGPALANDYYVVALDMPGFGLSAKPADRDYSNASQANTVRAFIKALRLRNVVIGGHSMGGTLALHVALKTPEVSGMILMNPGIITTGVPAITEYQPFPMQRVSARMFASREFRGNFLRKSYVRPEIVTEEVLDDVMLGAKTDDYYTGTTQMMKFYTAGDEIGMLDDVRVPTLIVWGVEDKNKPKDEATQLQALLPGSRLALIADAGHYVHEEKPEASAAAIIAAKGFWATRR